MSDRIVPATRHSCRRSRRFRRKASFPECKVDTPEDHTQLLHLHIPLNGQNKFNFNHCLVVVICVLLLQNAAQQIKDIAEKTAHKNIKRAHDVHSTNPLKT